MEPEAMETWARIPENVEMSQGVALCSTAISLKRIADALTYRPAPMNLFDYIKDIASK